MVAVYPLIFYFTNITNYKHRYMYYNTKQYKLMLHSSKIEVLQVYLLLQAKQNLFCSLATLKYCRSVCCCKLNINYSVVSLYGP